MHIIKIGGAVVDDAELLHAALTSCSKLGESFVLIHGGGVKATRLAEQLGIEQTMIDGRRVTNAETLDVAVMVYAGLINKNIVAALQALNVSCIGVTGADANLVQSTRRPAEPIDFGYVGDISHVNVHALKALLDQGFSVVISAITHDGHGQLLNTNADSIAGAIAAAVGSEANLSFAFNYPGIMRDVNDAASVIDQVQEDDIHTLIHDNVITKGMLPKVRAALHASRNGADVVIQHVGALGTRAGSKVVAND